MIAMIMERNYKKINKKKGFMPKKIKLYCDLDISTPESTFYLFPNVSKVMVKKGMII